MTAKQGGRRHGLSPSGNSPQVQFRLGEAATAQLKALAKARGCSMAEVIRRLLDAAISGHEP